MRVNGLRAFACAFGIAIITAISAFLSYGIVMALLRGSFGLVVFISLGFTFLATGFGFYLVKKWILPATTAQSVLVILYDWLIVSVLLVWLVPMTSSGHFFTFDDAIRLLIWIGLTLCIIFMASIFGRLIGAISPSAKSSDELIRTSSRPKISFAVPIFLMILLTTFMLYSGYQGNAVADNYYSEREAKWFLKNLATAEEAYFAEFYTYTKNLDALEREYGLNKPVRITVKITKIEKEYWEAETVSNSSGKKFIINSKSYEVKPASE